MEKHKMDNQAKEVYQKIYRKVLILHNYLQLYKQVYGSKESIEVINDSANSFFAMNQSIFVDNLILSIVRLLDPAQMGGYENLSLSKLIELIEDENNSSECLTNCLKKLLEAIQNIVKPLNTHRNKGIAHFDLKVIKNGTASLPDFEDNLYEAVDYLDRFMNEISLYYKSKQTDFEIMQIAGTDGEALINQLIKGKAYQRLEDEGKVENGYWENIYSDLP